ncbi:conserved hypothetical protein [Pediculus humanus corporis]|uniref:3'-5' exonuclease domain-containing protein n=1 Tax=Pediculus humanus subsp. corporis TaxID=121224 RepID=E0VFC6_PEDHC|nr:uncharacterized protein Phum_PHUM155110 [Pediculus humanus corporis]EEB12082.1 conserved hypothetical protein [Pediculus humanus corporis]
MESTEYELIRNMTLLFFFEWLLDKGGPRTLHDLSCQFGAKGFTKEMRQIAGGSQSGLKKFLSQYPSLFSIDGDFVYVNAITTLPSLNSKYGDKSTRDYAKEAIDYFRDKLLQYGPGTEVPIKSLLGHRSQASPEVRHMSGQHIKEFRAFLGRFPEVFVLRDENVILKEFENSEAQPFQELEQAQVDPKITANLIDFFFHCIEVKGPLLVEQLYQNVTSNFPEEAWSCIFKTSQDLATFLKMYSDSFHVQSNLVTLVNPLKKPLQNIALKNNLNYQNNTDEANNNLKPKFLPSELPQLTDNNNQTEIPYSPQKTTGSLTPPSIQNQTLKQRINSLVMKTLADNSEKDKNLVQNLNNYNSSGVTEQWKIKIMSVTKVINTIKESNQIIDDILSKAKEGSEVVVSVDCEGINLGSKGKLTLIQIGTMNGNVYVFDLVTCSNLFEAGGLARLLTSDQVIKVIHDCRNDSSTIYFQFGVILRNVFDTKSAHAVIQMQEMGKPVHKVKDVSLNTLYEIYNLPTNPMKEYFKNIYKKDQKIWGRRPLSRDMIVYAAADVLSLVPHLYSLMLKIIKPEYKKLLEELCEEQIYVHIKPIEVKLRKNQRKIETEVKDLKIKLSNQQLKQIVLSNREIRLLRYIDLTEKEKEKLRGSYKVAKKLEQLENAGSKDNNNYNNKSSDSDSDLDEEYPSLDSFHSGKASPMPGELVSLRSPLSASEPVSLTESMQMVDEILSDTQIDRLDKIKRLEEILSAATSDVQIPFSKENSLNFAQNEQSPGSEGKHGGCTCNCHDDFYDSSNRQSESTTRGDNEDVGCQTLSTGDIVITKIWFTEEEKEREKTLLFSPKKSAT